MATVEWTTVLDIGLPTLDEQHKKLISYFSTLLLAIEDGKGEEVLAELFEKLLDYTTSHFSEEEQYMTLIGYPEIDAHKAAHKKLLIDVGHFREKLLTGGDVTPDQAVEFMNGWIIAHIMVMDTRIGDFAKNRS